MTYVAIFMGLLAGAIWMWLTGDSHAKLRLVCPQCHDAVAVAVIEDKPLKFQCPRCGHQCTDPH